MAGIPIIMSLSSSMGPGGLASLQAGVQMIGQLTSKVTESIKELDKFAQVHKHLVGPIGEADTATHGLIDTMALMVQRNKIAEAGLKLTGKQYKVVAVAAVKMAQATGQDATAAFEKLTKSILMGSSRSLKEFGIDLDETEDQVKAQKESIEKLTAKYGETTVAIETTTEALYAMENNWGTFMGLMWGKVIPANETMKGSLAGINGAMAELNTELDQSPDAWATFTDALEGTFLEMINLGGVFDDILDQMARIRAGRAKLATTEAGIEAVYAELDISEERAAANRAYIASEEKRIAAGKAPAQGGGKGRKKKPKKAAGARPKSATEEAFVATPDEQARMDTLEMSLEGPTMMSMENGEILRNMDLRRQRNENETAMQERLNESRNLALNQELERIAILTGAVEDSTSRQAYGHKMVGAAANLAGDATNAGIQAIIQGSKGFKQAIWGMVSQRLSAIAVEEVILGARDIASGMSKLSNPFTAGLAILDFAAAGKHFAVATAAGAGAVGAGARAKSLGGGGSKPSVGSGGMVYGGGPGGGPAQLDRGGGGQVTYNIVLKDGAETMFEVISEEDERRRRSGQSTLGQAA